MAARVAATSTVSLAVVPLVRVDGAGKVRSHQPDLAVPESLTLPEARRDSAALTRAQAAAQRKIALLRAVVLPVLWSSPS